MENVELRVLALHETGNRLVLTYCLNAFTAVNKTVVPVVAQTRCVAKYSSPRLIDSISRLYSGETRTIACYSGVQHMDPKGPAMFDFALQPWLCRPETN